MKPTLDTDDINTISARRADAELLSRPLWRAEDLGKPIPATRHAASVALPLWEHVVRYEEKDPALLEALQCGYPRFVFNPIVNDLFRECRRRFAKDDELCLAFPSRRVAERCAQFLKIASDFPSRIEAYGLNDLHAVVFPSDAFDTAKNYWRHYGHIVSSRLAEATLDGRESPYQSSEARDELTGRIATLAGAAACDIRLYASGMAALSGAMDCAREARPGAKTIQFGFSYVDLMCIQTLGDPKGTLFHPVSEDTYEMLEWQIANEPVAAVFCEHPGNPLLQCADLERLSALLRKYGVPLVVDETLGSFMNVDVLPYADIVATSLTKYFSGVGDVMGGSLILNPSSPLHDDLSAQFDRLYEDRLWEDDAAVLEANSRDFEGRMRHINRNAEEVCEFLRGHPKVQRVHFPKFETADLYQRTCRADAGYGGMFSLVLKDAADCAPKFYDALRVSKGPSLGTNYTLACPYTLLAHFDELDWVESLGISPNLVRVSVGLENSGDLVDRFKEALEVVR